MRDYEDKIRKYLKERGWDRLRPGDIAKSISIEAAELLEIFQWDNPTVEEVRKDRRRMRAIKGELADLLIYCFDMSVLLQCDTAELFLKKLAKIKRKYPARLMRKRAGKEAGTESIYWKIKHAYRRKKAKART